MVTVIYPIFRQNPFFVTNNHLDHHLENAVPKFCRKFKVCVQEKKLRTSKKIHLEHQLCTWQCSKCLSTPLKVMENAILQHRRERQVSLGMLQTSYLSFDMRGTECVGQTMFTMMIPVDQNVSNIFSADKHLQHQVFSRVKIHVFMRCRSNYWILDFDVLSDRLRTSQS